MIRLRNRRWRQRGQSFVEAALLLPGIVFLFIGALDAGFYGYALIGIQSAARVAAIYTSSSSSTAADSTGACALVLKELSSMPNITGSITSCGALPLIVTAAGPTTDQFGNSYSTVTVKYQTPALMPIPGGFSGTTTLTRAVQMQIRS
ncbi:MAG TPA: TadE family protein [Bryobacteraceae bacterium]